MDIIKSINKLKNKIQKELNNTYIWSCIALNAFEEKSKDPIFVNQINFEVPRTKKNNPNGIKRSQSETKNLLDDAIKYDLYYSVFTYIVAQFEAYLSDVVRSILLYEPRKLLIKINGISQQTTINVSKVILTENRDDLILDLIESEIMSIFYASPKKMCEYFEEVLQIKIDKEFWENWFNYKAARDLIVHNRGVVNQIYNGKVSHNEKKVCGEKIIIDYNYYCNSIRNMKSLAGKISTCIKLNYIENEK